MRNVSVLAIMMMIVAIMAGGCSLNTLKVVPEEEMPKFRLGCV